MNQKIHIPRLLLTLAAVCLVVGMFIALDKAGYRSAYLNDTKSNHNGWEYEIRRDFGRVEEVIPKHQDEYQYTLSDGNYNAVNFLVGRFILLKLPVSL